MTTDAGRAAMRTFTSDDAQRCRDNGWTVGTRLAGDEGYGVTVIEITAIGERKILAKKISHADKVVDDPREGSWTLRCRDWQAIS